MINSQQQDDRNLRRAVAAGAGQALLKRTADLAAGCFGLAGLAAAGAAAAGVAALATGAVGAWARAVLAVRPVCLFAVSAACFLGWYVLARGIHNSLGDWVRFLARLLLLGGILFAGVLLLLIYKGGEPWAFVFYAKSPANYLAASLACFLGWYLLARGIHNGRREWKLFAARMILAVISLALALAAAEIGVRFFLDSYCKANSFEHWKELCKQGRTVRVRTTHPMSIIIRPTENRDLVYELRPDLDLEFGHRRLKTNRAGMRSSREYPVERLPRSVRILGIGDSGMFGWDIEQDDDYLAVLERNLNSRDDGVTYEALNFAVPGYNTQLEAEALRTKGLAYKPDIVVVGWCDNDYSLPFFLIQQTRFWRWDRSFLRLLLVNRKKFATLMEPVQFRETRKYEPEAVLPELVAGTAAQGVRQALRAIKQLASQHEFRLLVFGRMDDTCAQICRDEAIAYFNTREKIPPDKYPKEYAIYFMHPAREGHAALALELERCLDELGWLEPD